jgi:acetoin:2,6-dichlorophenolindophenol oxidoreductase subunit beta
MKKQSYKESIGLAMHDILDGNENAVLLGQGVSDPTKIFGTTVGLIEKFGKERVIDMPIMEEGMTGIAIGMALNGLYPVQTHIRVDFLMLAMNQLVNMAAKYRYMYGGTFEVPMLIRAVVGRSWGQGPQHSQSLQSLFAHIPGLTVIMPSTAEDAYNSYLYAATCFKNPVLSIEHRLLYDLSFQPQNDSKRSQSPFLARIVQEGNDVTIIATSYMVQEAQRASVWFQKHSHLTCEIIDLHRVSQIDHSVIVNSLKKTGRLIIADTSWKEYGVVAEVSRGILENAPHFLKKPAISLGMQPSPCPTSHNLEDEFYPDMSDIVRAISQLTGIVVEVPSKAFAKSLRKEFRGPF